MEQELSTRTQTVPGTPLQQISEQRINQLRIPQSPSVPAYLNEHVESPPRRDSDVGIATDVRSKIAFFQNGNTATNSFAIAGSPTRSPTRSAFNSPTKHHSRANSVMSIPSTPADQTQLIMSLQGQLEQSRNRERLVSERVESLMEQYSSERSRGRQESREFEREMKAMKKQVHRAELALIRCQSDLEESRKEQEGFKIRAEHERQAKEKSRQEAFERARTLASNVEELEVVKRERSLLLSENEALKSVQESMQLTPQSEKIVELREVGVQARLGTIEEGQRTMYSCRDDSSGKGLEVDIPVPDFSESEAVQELQEELTWVRSQLKREQDLVHFMNMQCQFRACPCRMAEKAGVRFVHDHAYDNRQQRLAQAKGTKRKAEDELPVPQYITLRERLDQKSRARQVEVQRTKISEEALQLEEPVETPSEEPSVEIAIAESEQQHKHVEADQVGADEDMPYTEPDDDSTLQALTTSDSMMENNNAGVIALHEAADIPLPSPRSDDPEPTALLEDMTEVMVEPVSAATEKHFAFSTSTSSRRPYEADTPTFRQSHNAIPASSHDDLFDIRPPRHLPPRPSTVMGVRTIGSPVRMVPPSPEHRVSFTPTVSPPRYTKMQVPLKDSPLRNAVTQRRSNSRSRDRSRARSPTTTRGLVEANSPSAETYFPVTPKQKNERSNRAHVQLRSNSQLQSLQSHSQAQATTTMVPLRGMEDDDVFSPEKPSRDGEKSHKQPLNLDTHARGRQPLAESDANVHVNSTVLPGTPITREAALAQIRARRDRARSVAMRKQDDEENGRIKTPKSAARRGIILNREMMGRDISNLSQASAPARF